MSSMRLKARRDDQAAPCAAGFPLRFFFKPSLQRHSRSGQGPESRKNACAQERVTAQKPYLTVKPRSSAERPPCNSAQRPARSRHPGKEQGARFGVCCALPPLGHKGGFGAGGPRVALPWFKMLPWSVQSVGTTRRIHNRSRKAGHGEAVHRPKHDKPCGVINAKAFARCL